MTYCLVNYRCIKYMRALEKKETAMADILTEGDCKKPKAIPRGRPKSGRVWKSEKQRKSAIIGVQPLHTSWNKKQQLRMQHKLMKIYEKELKDETKKQKEDKRKRIEERKKQREENEKKSQVVQVIKNTAKIKRMKKKQLRKIETR